ncbi:hypothetical protein F5Y14DRAFT_466220 [Nemania sp. NC0429]|nr:hypothetical protein F5Y14DRAFT_466220 [Nemania sp. NC0429]
MTVITETVMRSSGSITDAVMNSSVPTGYPTVKPAIVFVLRVDDVTSFQDVHNGATMNLFTVSSGSIQSVPGFEPAFKGDIKFAADWFSFDADGKHGRMDFKGVARTKEGHSIDIQYKGVLKLAPQVKMALGGHPGAKTNPFGFSTGYSTYIVSDESLKFLENSIFATNSRISTSTYFMAALLPKAILSVT